MLIVCHIEANCNWICDHSKQSLMIFVVGNKQKQQKEYCDFFRNAKNVQTYGPKDNLKLEDFMVQDCIVFLIEYD